MNDVDAAMSYLFANAININPFQARAAASLLLMSSDMQAGYGSKVGSNHSHHAYPGGLVIHTAEVLEIALSTAAASNLIVDKDVLTTAAIFHDSLKVADYDAAGGSTEYKKYIQHVAGSYALWERMAMKEDVPLAFNRAVSHCILAHHGRQEWGSPILPQTVEASILHYADMLSMAYGRLRVLPA